MRSGSQRGLLLPVWMCEVSSVTPADYAFTMPGKARQDEALSKVENLLNEIGCHGGNVQI